MSEAAPDAGDLIARKGAAPRDVYHPPAEATKHAQLVTTTDQYFTMHRASLADPSRFWSAIADTFTWFKKVGGKIATAPLVRAPRRSRVSSLCLPSRHVPDLAPLPLL